MYVDTTYYCMTVCIGLVAARTVGAVAAAAGAVRKARTAGAANEWDTTYAINIVFNLHNNGYFFDPMFTLATKYAVSKKEFKKFIPRAVLSHNPRICRNLMDGNLHLLKSLFSLQESSQQPQPWAHITHSLLPVDGDPGLHSKDPFKLSLELCE